MIQNEKTTVRQKAQRFWNLARFVLPYAWNTNRRLSSIFAASTAIGALLAPVLTLVAGLIVARLQQSWNQTEHRAAELYEWLAIAGAAGILGIAAGSMRSYCRKRLIDAVSLRVNRELLEHTASLDLCHLESSAIQALYTRATQNPHGSVLNASLGVLDTLSHILQAAGLLAILLTVEPLWSICLLLVALPQMAYRWILSKEHHQTQRASTQTLRWAGYYSSVLVTPTFVPSMKIMGLAPLFLKRFDHLSAELAELSNSNYRKRAIASVASAAVSILVMLCMIGAVAHRVLVGELGAGMFVAYWASAWKLRSTLNELGDALSSVFDSYFVVSNLQEYMGLKSAMKSAGRVHQGSSPRIELKNVSFSYPGARSPAVRNVSLTIEPGETIAIIGGNGAGKSTLAKLLCRLYDVAEGQVELDGLDIRDYEFDSLYRQFAYVQQYAVRIEASVHENLAYGDWPRLLDDPEEVQRLGRLIGVDQLARRLPQGYQTHLGRLFGEHDLSGGQWQRICIARAVSRTSASIVIMDEPAANLDHDTEEKLYDSIRDELQGKTAILITHHLSTIRMAQRIVVMHEGEIAEEGTHAELIALNGRYAAMYHSQIGRLTNTSTREAA